jgi:hypothetical protein
MSDEVWYDGTSGDPTVVWYDSGGITGWAVISVHPDALTDPECFVMDNVTYFACGEFYGNEFMQVDQMLALAETWQGAALGVEHWVLYDSSAGRKDENLTSAVRLNAAFRYGLYLRQQARAFYAAAPHGGIAPLLDETGSPVKWSVPMVFRQNASLGKDMPDAVLEQAEFHGRNFYTLTRGSAHKRDATKHALTFLKRIKGSPKLRAEAFPALSTQQEEAPSASSGA